MKAVDLLQKILDKVEVMEKRIDVIDRNVKQLMNSKVIQKKPVVAVSPKEDDDLFNFKDIGSVSRKKTIKTYGYTKKSGGIPIENVIVTVWNEKNDEVLKRTTNKNGYWEGRLGQGTYSIEYKKDGFTAVNKVFEIKKDMEECEVL